MGKKQWAVRSGAPRPALPTWHQVPRAVPPPLGPPGARPALSSLPAVVGGGTWSATGPGLRAAVGPPLGAPVSPTSPDRPAQSGRPPAPPAPRQSRWRRRPAQVLAGLGVVLAMLAGLVVSQSISGQAAPRKNVAPFLFALMGLANDPLVHYAGSSPEAGASWDISVTSGGEKLGTFTTAGQKYGVLTVSGVTYVKPPPSDLTRLDTNIPPSALRGQWIAGDSDVIGQLPANLAAPQDLANTLFSEIGQVSDYPLLGAPTVQIEGRPAQGLSLPDGTVLYVAASSPYQVLRVDQPSPRSSASFGASATGLPPVASPHAALPAALSAGANGMGATYATHHGFEDAAGVADLGQTDFEPETPTNVDQTYGDLIDQTKTLGSAPDIGVNTDYSHIGDLSCSDANCTVTENVTTTTTSAQPAALSGDISADMTANVTVDGEAGGGCTQTQILPITETSTMTCDDPDIAAPLSAIKAREQEEADAEGEDLNYTINFLADVSIEAMAEVQAQVTQQVDSEQAEQNAADQAAEQNIGCTLNSFVADTKVLIVGASTKPIQGVAVSDQIADSDPYSPIGQHHTITATHAIAADRDFIRPTVSGTGSGTINVTADHLFYDTTGSWTEAADLDPSDHLQAPGDGITTVQDIQPYTAASTTYLLTIDGVHTYYVEAGSTPVLVHNRGEGTILGDTSSLGGWIPSSIPSESQAVIGDIQEYGAEGQCAGSQFARPDTPRTFTNSGRNGGYQLPQVDSNGDAITGSDGSIYYTGTHYQTWIVAVPGS
jgi:Pretoxin HINT domain